MKKSRLVVFAGLLAFAITGLAAQDAAWKKDTSPVTLNWYINFSWFNYNWGESLISKYIEQKTGVKINFIVPAGNEAEKMNTMIASGTLPDIVTLGWWEGAVKKMIEGELVYSLDELAAKYDPAFNKIANSQLLGWYKQADGKTYGYPNFAVTPSDFSKVKVTSTQTFLVRKDMYEALGKPNMRTTEGFIKALQDAKKKFPTVNGQPLIPLGLQEFFDGGNNAIDGYLQNFLAVSMEKNGKWFDRRDDPEYIRWMKAMRKVNELGLLSPDVFIDKRAQMEEKIAQGRYFAMLYQRSDMVQAQQSLYDKDPKTAYIAVDGPANLKLDPPRLAGPGISGWTLTMVSKNAKNAARAIAFLSYWISAEGQRDMYLGKQGETWEMQAGKEAYLPKYSEMKQKNMTEFNKVVGQDPLWMLGNSLYQQNWAPPTGAALKQMEDWTVGKCVSYSMYDNLDPAEDSDLGVINKKNYDKWGRVMPKLLMAKTDAEFDSLYKAYQKERDDLGYAKLIDYRTGKLNENKTKLGIK